MTFSSEDVAFADAWLIEHAPGPWNMATYAQAAHAAGYQALPPTAVERMIRTTNWEAKAAERLAERLEPCRAKVRANYLRRFPWLRFKR